MKNQEHKKTPDENPDEQGQLTPGQAKVVNINASKLLLRSYSKTVFYYPLFIYSFIAFLFQSLSPGHSSVLYIWLILFFVNILIISFNFNVAGFAISVLLLIGIIILFIISDTNGWLPIPPFEISAVFYLYATIFLGALMGLVLISARFSYVKIEQNELEVKGILGKVERFPMNSISYDKTINNLFEYILLRSGEVTFYIPERKTIRLDVVINISKKAKILDALLSAIRTDKK